MTTNAANNAHAKTKLTVPHPPISLKSNSTCQSNTDAENADSASPANATQVRRSFRPAQSASAMNTSHAPPTSTPISASKVRCELTRVRTSAPSGSMNAVAISPDFPNPTPIGFAAKRRSPASHILGRFITAPSNASLGHIHQMAIATATTAVARPPRPCIMFSRVERVDRAEVLPVSTRPTISEESVLRYNSKATISQTSTSAPVLEYVIASITQSATPTSRPAHRHPPRHPQQNGNSAQIAAAAWLGFANPNPMRATSPTTNSTI